MKLTTDSNASRTFVFIGALTITIACFTAYIPAIKAGFIWDDDRYVTQNPLLTAPDGLYRIWFSTDAPSQYFPLTYSSYRIEYKFWKLNPTGYHIVNVAIHTINALLLWLVLRRLSIPGAWFASAVFALHPVGVETVAWISERKNLLMLLFSLLSVLCWIEFTSGDRTARNAQHVAQAIPRGRALRQALLFYVGSLLFFALALFGKATACTLPAALVLILWLKRRPLTLKRWLQVVPFVAMGIGMGLLVMWWEHHHQGTGLVKLGLGPAEKLLIAGRGFWFYLGKLFWPVNLTFSYPRWHIDAKSVWQYAWPAAAAAVLGCLWLWRERVGRGVVAAILFFCATLFPILGFFPLYTFVYTFVADHYQYAACIGPIALVSAGGAIIFRRLPKNRRRPLLPVTGAILITLWALSWRQSRIYTNMETLWTDTLKKNPDSWLAHSQMCVVRYEQGRLDEAIMHAQRRLALQPYMENVDSSSLSDGFYYLAIILEKQGRLDEAADNYQKALAIFENDAKYQYRLGRTLAKQGKFEQSVWHFKRSDEIKPDSYENYFSWGITLSEWAKTKQMPSMWRKPRFAPYGSEQSEKLFAEACAKLKKAIDIKPDSYEAYFYLGAVLSEWAKTSQVHSMPYGSRQSENLLAQACENFKKATDIKPDFYEAWSNWGVTLWERAKINQGEQSEKLFAEACENFKKATDIKPDFFQAYSNWGIMLWESAKRKKPSDENQSKKAIAMFMKVEELKKGAAAYNLACVWCVLGNEDECSRWLKIGEEEKMLPNRQYAIEDPDLEAFRDKEWFRRIRWKGE
jgi:tetratricopeptide (TPR) repeat protein